MSSDVVDRLPVPSNAMLHCRFRYPISGCPRAQEPGEDFYFIAVSSAVRRETEIRIVLEISLLCRTEGEIRSIRDTIFGNAESLDLFAEVTDCERAT